MAAVALLVWLPFAMLTAVGGTRRGEHPAVVGLSACLFPLAWVAWFVSDNRAAGRRAFQGH